MQRGGRSARAAPELTSSVSSVSASELSRSGGLDPWEDMDTRRSQVTRRPSSPPVAVRTVGTVLRHRRDLPWGIRLIQKCSQWMGISFTPKQRDFWYQASVLGITFLSYTAYHLSRKPISIVKNVLNQNCSNQTPPPDISANASLTWCDWAPFDGRDAETLLGTLDSSFLFAYAAGMFISGFVAERCNLRYFLALGMLLSGFFTYLFGLAYTRGIHNLSYFILVQALAGFCQTTGWPGVVTVVGNWFGKGKRGLIFGLWNSHTSLGNILGSLIAGQYVESDWGLSFIVPGAVIGLMGFFVFLFLVPKPQHVGCTVPDHSAPAPQAKDEEAPIPQPSSSTTYANIRNKRVTYGTVDSDSDDDSNLSLEDSSESNYNIRDDTPLISSYMPYDHHAIDEYPVEVKIKAVGFKDALKIPGVIEYSLCLFFAKLVSYTFLYWLPRYIASIGSKNSPTESANLSTLFDVGGIIGAIIAGVVSDYSGMSATTCAGMLTIAIPMLLVYESYAAVSVWANISLLIIVGLLVNGPYALITTAVSAELGTHSSLAGNARALATVTAIIDGTGSIGAAVGPLLAGPVSDFGWKYVFVMLMVADVCALLLLSRLVSHEIKRLFQIRNSVTTKVSGDLAQQPVIN